MGVPEAIRQVPRPKNTVVVETKASASKRYAVRERAGTVYKPGQNPQPRNGKIIGYIYNSKFVPKIEKHFSVVPFMLSYGASTLIHNLSADIFDDLLLIFDINDSINIMTTAAVKVMKPDVPNSRIMQFYKGSYLNIYYPGAKLSENTIEKLYEQLGMDIVHMLAFYELRTKRVCEDEHVLVDGTLLQDTSIVNDLSKSSRKSRVKGVKDISILYAYDLEKMEPICCKVYPGNTPDISAYRSFVLDNNIKKGIITADKAFPPTKIKDILKDNPDLHFITPIKNNDTRIKNNDMLNWQGTLSNNLHFVTFTKKQIKGGRFLYAFQDDSIAATENHTYLKNNGKNQKCSVPGPDGKIKENDYTFPIDNKAYSKAKETFGLIVLESDLDLPPYVVYQTIQQRWNIELFFRRFKNDIGISKTKEETNYRIIGSQFVNYIAAIISSRISQKFINAGLLVKSSYEHIMEDLSNTLRVVESPSPPKRDDGYWYTGQKNNFDVLEKLGLSEPLPKPTPKKRGRPRKTDTSAL